MKRKKYGTLLDHRIMQTIDSDPVLKKWLDKLIAEVEKQYDYGMNPFYWTYLVYAASSQTEGVDGKSEKETIQYLIRTYGKGKWA